MDLDEKTLHIFSMECKLFMTKSSFLSIREDFIKKCLNPEKQQELNSDIHSTFETLIETITLACPDLTKEDIIFCCLSKTDLNSTLISRYMGSMSRKAVNQRRYRVKKKMKEAGCFKLIDFIFSHKS